MDRQGYAQLNRIEEKLEKLEEGQVFAINYNTVDALQGFYEEEIQNPEGELHYLAKDEKLKAFFDGLITEEETEEESPEEESEMTSKPFK